MQRATDLKQQDSCPNLRLRLMRWHAYTSIAPFEKQDGGQLVFSNGISSTKARFPFSRECRKYINAADVIEYTRRFTLNMTNLSTAHRN